VNISALGPHEHNACFARRLRARGLVVGGESSALRAMLPPLVNTHWSGILVDEMVLDTSTPSLTGRHELEQACHAAGLSYAELSGPWHSLGEHYGFALFCGGPPDIRERLRPLLDALAPLPGAWLYAGPTGAGYFTAKVFDALCVAATLVPGREWPSAGSALPTPDWVAFFTQQQLLADRLLQLAQLYLSRQPPSPAPFDASQLLEAFSRPPSEQAHYADHLARLIVLALEQRHCVQDIFERLVSQTRDNGAGPGLDSGRAV